MAENNNIITTLALKILNHYIFKNFLILFILGFFFIYATLQFLRFYTNHGQAIDVPDVIGMRLSEAGATLISHRMRWQLSDSVHVASAIPGSVVSQNPEPGSKVKSNRNVFLVINAFAPEKVRMPDVVGVSHRQARSSLESRGLYIGRVTYVPYRDEGYVLRQLYMGQEIRGGTELNKGSEIELVLGGGLSSVRTSVPELTGKNLSQANTTITQFVLNLGVIIYDNTVITRTDTVNAVVYRQRPSASSNTMIPLGSSVDVWLTVDNAKVRAEENE